MWSSPANTLLLVVAALCSAHVAGMRLGQRRQEHDGLEHYYYYGYESSTPATSSTSSTSYESSTPASSSSTTSSTSSSTTTETTTSTTTTPYTGTSSTSSYCEYCNDEEGETGSSGLPAPTRTRKMEEQEEELEEVERNLGICLRTPFGPGQVKLVGCTPADLNNIAVIPESGTTLVHPPVCDTWYDSDGVYINNGVAGWFKCPDHCDCTIYCLSDGSLSVSWCCNACASICFGKPRWTTGPHGTTNPF